MEDKDLFEVWKSGDDHEKQLFKKHQGQYVYIAQKRSNDLFQKIKNNIIWEMRISIGVSIIFPFLFLSEPVFFGIILVLTVVASVIGFKIYNRYLQEMKNLNDVSFLECIDKKINILSRYIKQLKFYLYIFGPIGFAVGYSFSLAETELTLIRVLFLFAFALPFLALFIWLGKKYIYALYGRHHKRLLEIYNSLQEET